MDLVWQPRTVISPDGDRGRHRGGAPRGAGRRSAAGAAAVGRVVVWIAAAVGVGVDGDRVVAGDGEASGDGILQSWREREFKNGDERNSMLSTHKCKKFRKVRVYWVTG